MALFSPLSRGCANDQDIESVPFHNPNPYESASLTPGEYSLDWDGLEQRWPSTESMSPVSEPSQQGKVPIEPKPQPPRRVRKPQSGAALERRREQNRVAQLAFRERSKKQMEEMRQE